MAPKSQTWLADGARAKMPCRTALCGSRCDKPGPPRKQTVRCHRCVYTYVYLHIYYIYVYIYISIRTEACMYVCMYVYVYIHTHMYIQLTQRSVSGNYMKGPQRWMERASRKFSPWQRKSNFSGKFWHYPASILWLASSYVPMPEIQDCT